MHPIRWIISAVVLVALAIAGFAVWYVFGDSAPARPSLSTDASSSGGPASVNGTWKVVRGKTVYVGYRMTEVFSGDIVHKTAVGRTPTVDGTMTIANDTVTAAKVTGDVRDLKSSRGARDDYIHVHGLESDTYHDATFTLTKPIALPHPVPKGQQVKVNASGTLLLHGVTRSITIPLDTRWDGPTIEVVGTAPITLADYKIAPPQTSVVKTDNHGSLELSLTFSPS